MESRLEKIFSMGINCMSLVVWLGEDRKCFAAVVGSDLASGLSMVRSGVSMVIVFLYYVNLLFNFTVCLS